MGFRQALSHGPRLRRRPGPGPDRRRPPQALRITSHRAEGAAVVPRGRARLRLPVSSTLPVTSRSRPGGLSLRPATVTVLPGRSHGHWQTHPTRALAQSDGPLTLRFKVCWIKFGSGGGAGSSGCSQAAADAAAAAGPPGYGRPKVIKQ